MEEQQFHVESPIEELLRFRKSNVDPANLEIPEVPHNRRSTDKAYLITFIAVIIVLAPFMIYTLMHADFKHWVQTDDCGNFCGIKNEKVEGWSCSGKDFTDKPYMMIISRTCVESCPRDDPFKSCKKMTDPNSAMVKEAIKDIYNGSWIVILSMVISCALCFGMILLFKHAVEFVVWFLLLGSIGLLAILSGIFWFAYMEYSSQPDKRQAASGFLSMALVSSTIVIILLLLITCLWKRIQLIIQLFKEAAKAIFEIPCLVYLPILTFLVVSICLAFFCSLIFISASAAKLTEVEPNVLRYEPNGVIIFTWLYNLFVSLWVVSFLTGAQYIIIAGAVSVWFFTRNKLYLEAPLWTSFKNFVRFHLGTVLIGSLIIAIVNFIRFLIKALASNPRTRWILECCCNELLAILRFFSKNAYIQTALHGQPFFKSGKRALKLFVGNVENVAALNSIGNFVLVIAVLLLIVVSSGISFAIARASGNEQWEAIGSISTFLIVLLVSLFFSIFEATIDSIFMCFCEDTTLNDGMARPFFMSKGLHQFIENSKGVIPAKS